MITTQHTTHIPLTRVLLLYAWIGILASIMILSHAWYIGIPIAGSIFFFSYHYKHQKSWFIGITSLAVLAIITVRILFMQISHQQNTDFLNKPLIVRAQIKHIQHNTQEKKITTVTIRTNQMYNKDVGLCKEAKTILLQFPYHRAQNLQIGQSITLYKLELTQPASDQLNQDHYHLYLIKEGIWATGFISTQKFFVTSKRSAAWYEQFFLKLRTYFDTNVNHLYNPLFLGDRTKDALSLHIQHQSLYWGIAHHMARSGIHLVTLLGFCMTLFHYTRIRSRFRFACHALLVLGYAMMTVSSISFLRSLIMIMFQMFSKLHGFQYSGIHAFICTTLIMVLYNPYIVLFLDFQLSFGITAIILWLFYIKWTKIIDFLPAVELRS